jgi:hypothetical protein
MPLLQRHVDAYRARVIQGSHNKLRKDKMGEVVDFDIGNDSIDAADSREKSDEGNDTFMVTPLEYTEDPTQVVLHKEMFVESTSNLRDIRTTQDFFDFQFTDLGRISESKSLTM